MQSNPEVSTLTLSKVAIYRVAGGLALFSAVAAFVGIALFRPYLGNLVGYVLLPLIVAVIVWSIAGVLRLWIVGFLPAEAEHLIPPALKAPIRFWLLIRFGLLGGMFLLLIAAGVTALMGGPFSDFVEALVCVTFVHIFLNLIFGAAFNIGVISQHRRLT